MFGKPMDRIGYILVPSQPIHNRHKGSRDNRASSVSEDHRPQRSTLPYRERPPSVLRRAESTSGIRELRAMRIAEANADAVWLPMEPSKEGPPAPGRCPCTASSTGSHTAAPTISCQCRRALQARSEPGASASSAVATASTRLASSSWLSTGVQKSRGYTARMRSSGTEQLSRSPMRSHSPHAADSAHPRRSSPGSRLSHIGQHLGTEVRKCCRTSASCASSVAVTAVGASPHAAAASSARPVRAQSSVHIRCDAGHANSGSVQARSW
mmetsp:Transcript_45407/g.113627  ORF Transcript_45407/g.113627 Transcript_45407/m.113627 type:complete len:268 (+) Transcript_45407:609-1412(+)